MGKKATSLPTQMVAIGITIPVLLGFLILTNQSLSFPLGNYDQEYLSHLLRGEEPSVQDSWILSPLDRTVMKLLPRSKSFLMVDLFRRWSGILALVGLSIWVGRSSGWIRGYWVALIGIALLPLRIASTTLHPHSFFLFLFCWGCCLSFGKPWSKTGTAEQLTGGLFLGFSAFSAPLGFLYLIPFLIRSVMDIKFRKCLEQPFWGGLILGLLPGLVWLLSGSESVDLGIRPETWTLAKMGQLVTLTLGSLGIVLPVLLALGIVGCLRGYSIHQKEAIDLTWPTLLALALGEADTLRASLAVPGIILLSVVGLETVGKLFVAKKEQVLIPTLLVFGLSYHLFFAEMQTMRDRQAHAREVGSLANLVVNHVPDGAPLCLFRLNPVVDYLEALLPLRDWKEVDPEVFRTTETGDLALKKVVFQWVAELPEDREVWVDPKRMGEEPSMGGIGKELKSKISSGLLNETYLGESGAELARFPIPQLKPSSRGKITTIRSPKESIE